MDIARYLHVLRAHWLIILLLAALGGAAGALYSARSETTTYRAESRIFVSPDSLDAEPGEVDQGPSLSVQRVRSYALMVNSPKVLNEVIRRLNLPYAADHLARAVQGSSPNETLLLYIVANDPSEQQAKDIANTTAAVMVDYIAEIETRDGEATSPIRATIVGRAESATAIATRGPIDPALGVFMGLALGVAVAVIRHSFDRTIYGRRELAAVTEVPVIGEFADDRDARKHPLVADAATGPRPEALRRLRTNVRSLTGDHRPRRIVVTSAVRGEGSSTIAANLAIALARSDETVLLIDANLRNPSLAALFSVPDREGLSNVLRGELDAEAAMQRWREDLPLFVMTAGPALPSISADQLGSPRVSQMIAALAAKNMTVILDAPPLVPVTDAADLVRATDGALIVTRVGSTKADELAAAIDALSTVHATIVGIVANRVRPRRGGSGHAGAMHKASRGGSRGKAPDGLRRSGPERAARAEIPDQAGSASTTASPSNST